MRIGYLIGALGSGGSERQLSELAVGMRDRGHDVEVLCYDGPGRFDSLVQSKGANLITLSGGSKIRKVSEARRWIRSFAPDVVHGFMKRASSLAVLAARPGRTGIVASDFSTATYARHKPVLWASLALFGFADRVVTQTEVNRRNLARLAPWIRGRIQVVRNGVDIERFRPSTDPPPPTDAPFRFLCVGSVWKAKNPVRIVEAVAHLRTLTQREFRLDWVGRTHTAAGEERPEYARARRRAEDLKVADIFSFRGEAERVEQAYHSADALLHASVQDGIPNAVVEGMASGLPVVLSSVSDLPLIVENGRNGFVCDPLAPASIGAAMHQMLELPVSERAEYSSRSRTLATDWFARRRFLDEYERLYRDILEDRGD